jgi:hypothetical protein
MLEPENERQLLIDNEAALVIFPQHVRLLPLLRLVLRKWEWLESVYDNEPRPFAYSMTGTGIITKENLVHYTPRRHRPTWPPKQPGARRTRRLGPGQPPLLT